MIDSRCQTSREELYAAREELLTKTPDLGRVEALLDDARCGIVEMVESGIGGSMTRSDLNNLDSARCYINRALELLQRKAWAHRYVKQFVRQAIEHVELSMSNVVPFPDVPA